MSTHPTDDRHVVLGSGPAGSTLAAELAARGRRVTLVDRSGNNPAPKAWSAVADATDAGQLTAATAGAAVIYQCVNVAYHLQVDVMPAVSTAVLAAASANDARLVVLDTLYPYGEADGGLLRTRCPQFRPRRGDFPRRPHRRQGLHLRRHDPPPQLQLHP